MVHSICDILRQMDFDEEIVRDEMASVLNLIIRYLITPGLFENIYN